MEGLADKLQGGGEEVGSFMALLNEAEPAPATQQQRLGSLAQPGPGERGACWAAVGSSCGRGRKFENAS